MDLLKEAKKSNKEAYLALVDKYNVIFYKVARIYHHLDVELQTSIEKALLNTYHGIINCRNEHSFLCLAIQELVSVCEQNNKKISNKNNNDEVAETLLKNAKYRMYKTDSIIEKTITTLDKNNRLPALLYFYVGLSVKEISYIANISKLDVKKSINSSTEKLYDQLKDNFLGNKQEELIKNAYKEDQISDQQLFDKITENIKNSKVKVSTFSHTKQVFLLLFLLLILLGVGLFFANKYFDLSRFIPNNNKPLITNEIENKVVTQNRISNSTNSVENAITNKIENNTIDSNTVNNIINNTANTVLNNVSNNTINNDVTNTVASNTTTNRVSNGTTYANLSPSNKIEDYSVIDTEEVKDFIKDFAIGIKRLSLDEENLESNTILLYIARHYFDKNSSSRNSLDINTDLAPNQANIHKFLTELTGKDYSRTSVVRSYNNYVGYTSTSKSYIYGKDIKELDSEKYTVSSIEITNEFDENYTAVAKVSRTLDDVTTDYKVTFTFSVNKNYKYQKYCLKSIDSVNLTFFPDNTVHLVEVTR